VKISEFSFAEGEPAAVGKVGEAYRW
jgi:hypothetical protein